MAIHNSGALRARIRRRKDKKDVHMILNTVIPRLHVLRTWIRRFRALIKGLRIQGLQITDSAIKRGAQKQD